MKKGTITGLLMVLTTALITSCGPSLKVSSDYDRTVNFSSYKTFSMYEVKASANVNQLNQERIEKYIRAEMTKRGYVETKTNPDLKVNAVTVLNNKKGVSASTSYYGYGGFYRPYGFWPASGYTSVSTYDYKAGSLVIDVIDAKIDRMIWTGSGSAEVYSQPKNHEEVISEVVTKIMSAFPIPASGKM